MTANDVQGQRNLASLSELINLLANNEGHLKVANQSYNIDPAALLEQV